MKVWQLTSRRRFLKLASIGTVGTVLLAACAPSAAPPATQPSEPTKAAAGSTPATQSATSTTAPTPAAAAQPSGEKVKISVSHIGGGSLDGSDKSYRMKQLRAAFPSVEIDNRWMSYSAYVEKISLMTSTGDLADLQFANAFNDVPLMMENNLLVETGALLDKEGTHIRAATPPTAWDSTTYDGKQFAVAHSIYDLNIWGIYYRKDWLDKLGLKVPETLDEYTEVLKATTFKDPTGTGRQTFGRVFLNSIKFDDDLFHAFDAAVGHHANGFWRDRGGKLELDWVQPGMKEAWAWLKARWAEKVIDPDSITAELTYWGTGWTAGKIGTQYSAWSSLDSSQLDMRKTDPKAEIISGPALKGPSGHQGFTGEGFPWVYVTPKKTQHPEVAVRLIDWFFIPQNSAKFVCDGEPGYTLKGFNEQGWCQEYTLAERQAMGKDWTDKQTAAQDIAIYGGIWTPILSGALRPWLLNTMPPDMKSYFEGVLKARYSPAALVGMDYAQKYVRTTQKKRPTKSEKTYWPRLQSRFLELMTQGVVGTIALEQGWKEWLSFFDQNGGPTLTTEQNEIK